MDGIHRDVRLDPRRLCAKKEKWVYQQDTGQEATSELHRGEAAGKASGGSWSSKPSAGEAVAGLNSSDLSSDWMGSFTDTM